VWSAGAAGQPSSICDRLSIYFPGSDLPETTEHRFDAIFGTSQEPGWPAWSVLTRRTPPRTNWYRSQPYCQAANNPQPGIDSCDEYPYDLTYQGGTYGAAVHMPSLRWVNAGQNSTEGSKWGSFLTKCKIVDSQPFMVVPLRPVLGIPTITDACAP
jgi:hypothetical protein